MQEKILVVDDEKEISDLLEVYFSNEGYRVLKCYSGKEALDAIQKEGDTLDLAVLDIMLPDLSGFDLCCRIREKMCIRDSGCVGRLLGRKQSV